ncbi:DNA polymerase III subunit gamma/tau [Limosilactobacillus equigenerosi]|uniref:DNA polymerase III subunit gamma/tau n=1 Tax=Limosilactobacillus equigenerosi TaxID=417373 RepID=UPI000705443D|nr:DNA polymerase III subunit gamma/tau [Limosilactobacillus equigenerosi]
MSYQALYRVWRPQKFQDMVGQEVVVKTLKNSIITKQMTHAYLFSGPRGTGKTSAAKIFAKAINCHHQVDGEPCNECEICQAITNNQLGDVIEIDAASNNGVEEIRDIRDKAKYAPTLADYKVYIIDEVHMLSTGAFNALLKTLEEPPANVIFILATTEPHKIPLTIISRVQRFDFRRISPQQAFDRMVYILDQKQIPYDEQALRVVANAAEGGMRDALSILDQVLSYGQDQVDLDNALLVTGSVTKQLLKQYFLQVVQHESAPALETMGQILAAGKDGQRFTEDLLTLVRDVLLFQEARDLVDVVMTGLTSDDFTALAQATQPAQLYTMIDTINHVQDEMRFTNHPDVYLEVLTVRLSQPDLGVSQSAGVDNQQVSQLQAQVNQLQQQLQQVLARPAQPAPTPTRAKEPAKKAPVRLNLVPIHEVLGAATRQDLDNVKELWGDLLNILVPAERSLISISQPVAASPTGVVVAFDNQFLFQRAVDGPLGQHMAAGLQQLTGNERTVTFVPAAKWPEIRQDYLAQHQDQFKAKNAPAEHEPVANPVVDEAAAIFGADNITVNDD